MEWIGLSSEDGGVMELAGMGLAVWFSGWCALSLVGYGAFSMNAG